MTIKEEMSEVSGEVFEDYYGWCIEFLYGELVKKLDETKDSTKRRKLMGRFKQELEGKDGEVWINSWLKLFKIVQRCPSAESWLVEFLLELADQPDTTQDQQDLIWEVFNYRIAQTPKEDLGVAVKDLQSLERILGMMG